MFPLGGDRLINQVLIQVQLIQSLPFVTTMKKNTTTKYFVLSEGLISPRTSPVSLLLLA